MPSEYTGKKAYISDTFYATPELVVPERIKADNPEIIFGENRIFNPEIQYNPEIGEVVYNQYYNSIIFSSLIFSLFIFSAFTVYRFREQFVLLIKYIFSGKDSEDINEEQGITFKYFVNIVNWLGFFVLLTVIFELCLILIGCSEITYRLGPLIITGNYIVLLLVFVLAIIFVYRFLVHKVILLLSMDIENIPELIFFNKIMFAFLTIIYIPFILALPFWGIQNVAATRVILLWLPLIFFFYYGFKTYRFFIVRKFSIFQWFLYLCAMEILPVSFFIISVMRSLDLKF